MEKVMNNSFHQENAIIKDSVNEGTQECKHRRFNEEERNFIQKKLDRRLGPEYITYRSGGGGSSKIPYIEGWRAINLANETFGFDGWSSSVTDLTVDFVDDLGDMRVNCGVSAMVRIRLKDGSVHEDIGYGISENQRGKGAALEKAKKEAITDATKRALRLFGSSLGNCVYDKEYLKYIRRFESDNHAQQYNIAEFRRDNGLQQALRNKCPNITTSANTVPGVTMTPKAPIAANPVVAANTAQVIGTNIQKTQPIPPKTSPSDGKLLEISNIPKHPVLNAPISSNPRALKRSMSHPCEGTPTSDSAELDDDLYNLVDNVELDLNANNYKDAFETLGLFEDEKK